MPSRMPSHPAASHPPPPCRCSGAGAGSGGSPRAGPLGGGGGVWGSDKGWGRILRVR
eukprot:COSAG01_NODE_45492_length_409_cov_0.570968_1_plen_56_part_10